jgi:hypothetical protein
MCGRPQRAATWDDETGSEISAPIQKYASLPNCLSTHNFSLSSPHSSKTPVKARCWWLMPVILATQETETKGMVDTHHKKGLVEQLKVKVLSSSPSTTGKGKQKIKKNPVTSSSPTSLSDIIAR